MSKVFVPVFHQAKQEFSFRQTSDADALRDVKSYFQLKTAVSFSLNELHLERKETERLRNAMSVIFAPKGTPALPLTEMKERTRALLAYLRSSVSHTALDSGLSYTGRMTPEFKTTTQKAWEEIPSAVRTFLLDEGFSMQAGETSLAAFPDHADVSYIPSEDDPRTHITHMPGLFTPFGTKACAAQFFLDARSDPRKVGFAPTPESILLGHWKASGQSAQAIAHESAHGLDLIMTRYLGISLSDTTVFKRAYRADIKAMGGFDAARRKGYTYYVREDELKSRKETFAQLESFCWLGNKSSKMTLNFLHCHKAIVTFNKAFVKARKAGLTSFMHFANSIEPAKDGRLKPAIASKWTHILRTKENISEDDINGWAAAVPDAKIRVLAKNFFLNGASAVNDKIIVEQLVKREVHALMSASIIDEDYVSPLHSLASIPAFKTMLTDQAHAYSQQPAKPPRSPQRRVTRLSCAR